MKHRKHVSIFFVLIGFGCSIIEDSDIQNLDELDKLKLSGFIISQSTSTGSSSSEFTLLYDSAVTINVDDGDNTTVKRIVRFKGSSLSGKKMQFKSGASTNLQIYNSFLANNKPYTWVLYQGDSAVEIYRFRYDGSGKLNKIITIINPVDGQPFLLRTNDTIIYNGTTLSSIIRRSPDAAKAGSFTGFLINTGEGIEPTLSNVTFKTVTIQGNPGNCPENSGSDCRGYHLWVSGINGGSSTTIQFQKVFDALSKAIIADEGNNISCCRAPDKYYFHPLMFWNSTVDNGSLLLPTYMIDWLIPGAEQSSGGGGSNESELVTISYIYER